MVKKCFLLIGLLVVCIRVHAGVQDGIEAFQRAAYADARKILEPLAEQQDPAAMAYFGEILMRGLAGAKDELKARRYFNAAHETGQIRATYQLGLLYTNGYLVTKDAPKGVALIKQAAEKSYPAAQSLLAVWMIQGNNGFTKDDSAALPWLRLAAANNDPIGLYWLGQFYEQARAGLSKDLVLAKDQYHKAARLGHFASQVELGRMYALGLGMTANGNEALRWLFQAAAMSQHSAYYWIGNIYEYGRGDVPTNFTLAYAWYHNVPINAMQSTLKNASEGKERLRRVLTPAEITEAEKQAKPILYENSNNILSTVLNSLNTSTARHGLYGSGVVVSLKGDILTNEHVIQNCMKIRIQPQGWSVKLIAKDSKTDLAILRLEQNSLPSIPIRTGSLLRQGDEIITLGFPLRGNLPSHPVVTSGIINALTGFNNDTATFQMSATIHPGSSGGPILDRFGLLVGIVRARLLTTGQSNPQNVNFGLNLTTVTRFLETQGIDFTTRTPGEQTSSIADIFDNAQKSTVQIECY